MNLFEKGEKAIRHLGRAIGAKSPVILTGCAVAGVITTVIFAVSATPKAEEILREHKKQVDGVDAVEKRRVIIDTTLSIGRVYLLTIVSGAATIACIIGANSINTNRQIALATAYNLSTRDLREWKEKTKQFVGEKKTVDIEDDIRSDHVKTHPLGNTIPIETGHGHVLCFDDNNGRYFYSTPEYIKRVLMDAYAQVLLEDWMSYDDIYFDLGLPTAKNTEYIGISSSDAKDLINFGGGGVFSSMLNDDNEPVLVLSLPKSYCPWRD